MPRFGRAYPLPLARRRCGQVTFDAVGGGGTYVNSFTSEADLLWTHTSMGNVVLVALTSLNYGQAPSANTAIVGYGGFQLASLIERDVDYQTFVQLFGAFLPQSLIGSAQTVGISVIGSSSTGRALVASSVSYANVGAGGFTVASNANSAATSLSVPSNPGELVVNAIGSGVAQSAYSQSTRYSQLVSANPCDVLIGDAPGAPGLSFTSTLTSSAWASVACRLLPIQS